MRSFKEYLDKKKREHGDKFDSSDLAIKFIPYFENEKRIEVKTGNTVIRGTVGVTTGWKPVFLLMLAIHHEGSSWTLNNDDIILKEVTKK